MWNDFVSGPVLLPDLDQIVVFRGSCINSRRRVDR